MAPGKTLGQYRKSRNELSKSCSQIQLAIWASNFERVSPLRSLPLFKDAVILKWKAIQKQERYLRSPTPPAATAVVAPTRKAPSGADPSTTKAAAAVHRRQTDVKALNSRANLLRVKGTPVNQQKRHALVIIVRKLGTWLRTADQSNAMKVTLMPTRLPRDGPNPKVNTN